MLNVLLVGAIAYFAALAASDLFAMRLASSVVPVENIPQSTIDNSELKPEGYYQVIIRRDIFNTAPAPAVVQAQPAAPEDDDLRITLLGTSHITGSRAFAIIEDQNGDQVLYRQGDLIPDAGQLIAIGRDRAIVLHNGRQIALEIPSLGGPDEADVNQVPGGFPRGGIFPRLPRGLDFRHHNPMMRRRMPGAPGASSGVHQLSPNHYLVDRSTVNSDTQDMAKLFTQVRAMPNLQNGSSNGFALSEIQPGSIFDQLGLHDGDVVTTVAGQPMNDPRTAITVLESLSGRSSIQMSVLRNGAPVNLSYTIR
jgi:type II secretion system protein C